YGKKAKDLTEAEKENISALAQLATGLAVASVGGDVGDVSTGIAAGKNAVENNFMQSTGGGNFELQAGFVDYAGSAQEVVKELEFKCGNNCTPDDYREAFEAAGIINRFDGYTEEQRKAIYMLPLFGIYYGGVDAIKERDIRPLLEAGLSQTEIGGIIMMVYRNRPNMPTESEVLSHLKKLDDKRTQQSTNNNQANSTSTGSRTNSASPNPIINPATNKVVTEHIIVPSGKAPKTSTPNSIYEVSRSDGSRSVTYYDERGNMFSREDYGQQRIHGNLEFDNNGKVVPHEHKQTYKSHNGKIYKDKSYYRQIDENGKPVGPWILDK
ncbi:VENN motif pre-toxin domain-containing protein, partial [uncultured Gilliamella sp.]|uniref:VENN motif pre-toxin domain-containing protein n=1 Tax=uncultured Gilliamella sp. TaxID=1193505 RepID=UPI0025E32126